MQDTRTAEPIDVEARELPEPPDQPAPVVRPLSRPTAGFMVAHPAHLFALGFGSGLARWAPGTVGTLWGWLAFLVLSYWLDDGGWAWAIGLSLPLGWWACTVTARNLGVLDPGNVVWDEIVAIWLVLWLVMPAGFTEQAIAFALFRFFDAVKPGPVGWADRLFHHVDPATDRHAWSKAGFGIMLDDLVAAGCTLLVFALWRFL